MSLGEKLRKAIDGIRKATSVDKETIKEAVKEIQRALISSDVEVGIVLELSKKIEKEAFGEMPEGITRREFVVKKTYDALVEVLGGTRAEIPENPKKILLAGLFGGGKTTTTVKLAKWYAKRGKKVGVICADTFRAAAFEQLQQLSKKAGVAFYGNKKEKNAAKVVRQGLKELKGFDLIIVDSAGRSALDKELVKEIKEVNKVFEPEYSFLVLSADIGQIAKKQAKAFHEAIKINGVILTKIDGSAKGGGALAACTITNSPVFFIGTGEKIDDFQAFNPERYLSRIMGFGDLQALLEKVKEIDEVEELSPEEILKGEFNLEVFYKQLKAARKMGPLSKVMEMMGLSMQIPKEQLEIGEEKLDSFKVIMDSMTKEEKRDPDVLNHSRIQRIAKGSGKSEKEVRELLKHFKQMKNMFKKFKKLDEASLKKGMDLERLAKMFGKKKKLKIR